VDKLEHEALNENGTEIWDVLSKENLDISYGIYIYHVTASGSAKRPVLLQSLNEDMPE
jgi:hypothetical protein